MEITQLSKEELNRYARHIIIPEINLDGQKKLKAAKVLVIGAGGLGSPVLLYLAAAGIGTIGIVDFDVVEDSNLQRQVLYGVNDVGRNKTEAAKERILNLNPFINVITYPEKITSNNAIEIIKNYDIVADGTDNFGTRYLINDACVLTKKPNVFASISKFEGQVSVFNLNGGPNYRDLFPESPAPGSVPNCAEGGVLGVLPGIIGSMQANEVIKIITGIGEPLTGKLFTFNALTFATQIFKINKDKNNPLNGETPTINTLSDSAEGCSTNETETHINEISPIALKQKIDNNEDFHLIDVRTPQEYNAVNIGGTLIPLNTLLEHTDSISTNKPVIVLCKSGARSIMAIKILQQKGFTNLINLKGGIMAYAQEVDNTLPLY